MFHLRFTLAVNKSLASIWTIKVGAEFWKIIPTLTPAGRSFSIEAYGCKTSTVIQHASGMSLADPQLGRLSIVE